MPRELRCLVARLDWYTCRDRPSTWLCWRAGAEDRPGNRVPQGAWGALRTVAPAWCAWHVCSLRALRLRRAERLSDAPPTMVGEDRADGSGGVERGCAAPRRCSRSHWPAPAPRRRLSAHGARA